eukprot:Opistho-1_new@67673
MVRSFSFALRLSGLLFAALLVGCATPPRVDTAKTGYVPVTQIQAKTRFDTVALTSANFGAVAKSCISTWRDTATQRIISEGQISAPRGSTVVHSHSAHASYLVVVGNLGFCVQQSERGYPILASEAFYKTVNPEGPPAAVTDAWYAQIAELLAREGSATAIYTFSNGNAYVTKYWFATTPGSVISLNYSADFKRAGQWSATPSDIVLTHPATSTFSVVQYNNRHAKNFLAHRP